MKKKLLALFMAFAMVISTIAVAPIDASSKKSSYGKYAYSVLQYIDKNLTERRAGTEVEEKAAEFIKSELESFGYEAEIVDFTETVENKWTGKKVTYESQNVIATKKGKSSKEIIVGAHYDSVGTHGVDDNGSGVVVNLETAKRLAKKSTPYTIKFVFFGAEEVGKLGSLAYVKSMTEEEIANTLYMVNMDSMLAGTYRYVYGGKYNKATGEVERTWVVEQTKELSDALGTGMRLNNTELNYHYPSPSTGSWSDHASFWNILPYVYFEASNWEVLDSLNYPEDGSSGDSETEIGRVMHVAERDNLEFIEGTWGPRGKNTISAYCKLLEAVLYQVSPDGLVTPSKDKLEAAIEKAEKLSKDNFTSKSNYYKFTKALKEAKKVADTKYVLLKDQAVIDRAVKDLTKTMAKARISIKDATITYKKATKKSSAKVTVKCDGKVLKKGRDYSVKYSYSKSKKSKTVTVTVKGTGKYIGEVKETFAL